MGTRPLLKLLSGALPAMGLAAAFLPVLTAQQSLPFTQPEQRHLQLRTPEQISGPARLQIPAPHTIADATSELRAEPMTLDEAIRIGLERADVVRFLAGISASTSGRTLYDVAIVNTGIDVQNALFDPQLDVTSTFNRLDQPFAVLDPANPGRSLIQGAVTDTFNTSVSLSQRLPTGAQVGVAITPIRSYFAPGLFPLDPETRSRTEFSWRQPLMRGAGWSVNQVPLVIARLDTERSYFQYKDAVQELVRGIINGYWNLVAARVEVWAREQQVEQAEFAFERARARLEEGLGRASEVAQAESALANFRASLILARSNRILSETALRNVLGLPPSSDSEIVPVSEPLRKRVDLNWNYVLALAEQARPDLIELRLILEADQQLLIQAENQARPQFDGIANYRWDGLRGEMPIGDPLRSDPGQFTGWNVGVNFSVPIGLRQSRADLRRQELNIRRDQLNLEQGLHQMTHQLAINYRNLEQFYAQIEAFGKARQAALVNFENQISEFQSGRQGFLNVLQAITDWGNAVAQEAQSVTQYNTELANIERQTGTILEGHGIVFYEERFAALGPLGRRGPAACYPAEIPARAEGMAQYPDSGQPSERSFDLRDLGVRSPEDEPLPAEDLPSGEPVPGDGLNPPLDLGGSTSNLTQKQQLSPDSRGSGPAARGLSEKINLPWRRR